MSRLNTTVELVANGGTVVLQRTPAGWSVAVVRTGMPGTLRGVGASSEEACEALLKTVEILPPKHDRTVPKRFIFETVFGVLIGSLVVANLFIQGPSLVAIALGSFAVGIYVERVLVFLASRQSAPSLKPHMNDRR